MTTLPAGFNETLVTTNSNLSRPTAMEFSPTGQLWVLEQDGDTKVVDLIQGTTSVAGSLSVDSRGERGLLGIAFDPRFDGAGPNVDHVYLFYTAMLPSAHNRVSRFVVNNAGTQSPTLGAETIVLEIEPEPDGDGSTNHNGGAIHFGVDELLYISVGDHNADGSQFRGSAHVSQRLDSLQGKLLRIDVTSDQFPDDPNRNYAIPPTNPFIDNNPSTFDETFALGLRNPYTFAVQPEGGKIFVNDVGQSQWEEINQASAGANFGWASEQTVDGFASGFESVAPSYALVGVYANPVMAFDHSSSAPSPAGCAITGGAFYPTGGQFGEQYAGKYFFADYCGDFIRVFDPADPGSLAVPDTSSSFASGLTSGAAVDLKIDQGGRLYYLARGGTGEIYRISTDSLTLTSQPTNVTASPGQIATFTVVASGTGPLSYQWQRADSLSPQTFVNLAGENSPTLSIADLQLSENGDQFRVVVTNANESTTSNPAILSISVAAQAPDISLQPADVRANEGQDATFRVVSSGSATLTYQWQRADRTNPAQFQLIPGATSSEYTLAAVDTNDDGDRFRVVVRNSAGVEISRVAKLDLNRSPQATIIATPTYAFGDVISFSATATDPEDGVLPASAFTWTIDFGHRTHFHPHVEPSSGSRDGSFVADFIEPDPDQAYHVRLDVVDSDGATHTSFAEVQPRTVLLTLLSRPFAVPLLIDGESFVGAQQSVIGSVRGIQSPELQNVGGTDYLFSSWSDGGDAAHAITTPDQNTTYVAQFLPAPLMVTFADNAISEAGGSTTATVTRRGNISQTIEVTLRVDDHTEASIPSTLFIPAGQASASFLVLGLDDAELDGPQAVTITASSARHSDGQETLHVFDDEGAKLSLSVSNTSFSEDAGPSVAFGTVTRNTNPTLPLTVALSVSDASEVRVPETVTIPAGESSTEFPIDAVDDTSVDGVQLVQVIAAADHFESDAETLRVSDAESWRNPFQAGDVNADGMVTAIDALLIVNELGRREFSDPSSWELTPRLNGTLPFFDTNGDGYATAIDVLLIINLMSRISSGDGEGELTIPTRDSIESVRLEGTVDLLARDHLKRTETEASCLPIASLF
ncbi:MAG: PQQ-dependent sugar dehydrogenase [Rubripirellula sp.]